MSKRSSLLVIASISLMLAACGGGGGGEPYNPMDDKNYIFILKEVPEGVCESELFRDTLKEKGFEGLLTKETDTDTSCQTYGKSDDGEECIEEIFDNDGSYDDGDKNCIVGFDGLSSDFEDDISYRGTNEAKKLDLHTLTDSISELLDSLK